MKDIRQSSEYANYMEKIGWKIKNIENSFIYIKRFPIIGSFIKLQRSDNTDLNKILQIAKLNKAFQVIIEPKYEKDTKILIKNGFRQSKTHFVPSKTIHIDLTKSQKTLLSEMHHKTRYNIKKTSSNNDLKTRISYDINKFAEFWQDCAKKQRGMFLSQKKEISQMYKAFKSSAKLVTVNKDKELLSAVLLIKANGVVYYMFAASSKKGKKLSAPTLNVWESIKLAKKLKCKVFDFEGIYDDRFPLKTWEGFSRFKKSFGGRVVKYPGTFSKFRIPI